LPHFIPIAKNVTLADADYVIGVVNGGVSTAYPLKILAVHQVVNDSTQQPPVAVYFGNSSRTAAAFNAEDDGAPLAFGSSGYLYDNVDLLFDIDTESFFLPLTGMFVSGEKIGRRLTALPCAVMPLAGWRALYPDSRLMSDNTGAPDASYPRNDVFAKPLTLKTLLGGVSEAYDRTAPVIAMVADGDDAVAIPFPAAKSRGKTQYPFSFDGCSYVARFADDWNTAWITDPSGTLVPSVRTVWHVYAGLVPKGAVATPH
jgi:hypothetical protein